MKENINKTSPLPVNLFKKQVESSKTGFEIKIISKKDETKTLKENKNGNID